MSLAEVKHILKAVEKGYKAAGAEPFYEQQRALEHASRYAKLNLKDATALTKKISELELGLTPERVIKIVDLLPETVDDVRAIFAKERFKYSEDEIKQIIDIVDGYR